MCIITLVPGGVEVPWDGIINGGITNDDGHGWAAAAGDRLLIGKSMDLNEALESLEKALDDLGKGAVVLFHSRFATHGLHSVFNVHPFWIGGEDNGTVMAHNGVLPSRWHPERGKDQRSDTHKFADNIGGMCDNALGVPSRRGGKTLAEHIGGGNKLTFLSVRSGQPKVRIVNSRAGVFVDGVWFSNHGFEKASPRYSTYSSWREVGHTSAGVAGGTGYTVTDKRSSANTETCEAPAKHHYGERGETLREIADRTRQRESRGWGAYDDDDAWPSTLGTAGRLPGTRASTRESKDWAPTFSAAAARMTCIYCRGQVSPTGYCTACKSCQDCYETIGDCLCYAPRGQVEDQFPDGTPGTAEGEGIQDPFGWDDADIPVAEDPSQDPQDNLAITDPARLLPPSIVRG